MLYASLYGVKKITATLVYPLRASTYLNLKNQARDRSYAELYHGGREIILELNWN